MNRHNILVITQWSYKDPLIQTYTLPYVNIIRKKLPPGSRIFLVTFEQERLRLSTAEKKETKESLAGNNIVWIPYSYASFGLISIAGWIGNIIHLFSLIFVKRIKHIHAWAPTAGALGYVLSRLTATPLVIDSYEPHAEAMVENGTWQASSMKFKILFRFEKLITKHASFLVSATEGMKEYARLKYGVTPKRFLVKPACVDLEKINPSVRKNQDLLREMGLQDKIVGVYAGKFGGIYLQEEAFDLIAEAGRFWGDRFRMLLLTPELPEKVLDMAKKRDIDPGKLVIRFVPHHQIAQYIGLGDFGITPVKPVPTKRFCTPIKDGEYWALGLPVIITKNISDDSQIILDNDAGAVIESLDASGYRSAVEKIDRLLSGNPAELQQKIRGLAVKYRSFEIAEKVYEEIYGSR